MLIARSTNSGIPIEQYHVLSDATMRALLERLESVLDELGRKDMEVDYHVSILLRPQTNEKRPTSV